MLRKTILYLSAILLCSSMYASKQANYFFKQVSIEDGLSQSTVTCILYDSKGFLWIGTRVGLNRYDTYKLKNYINTPENNVLPSNNIIRLAEDKDGKIWIVTDKGVSIFDHQNNTFKALLHNDQNLNVKSLIHTSEGILLGSTGSLLEYSYKDRNIKPIKFTGTERIKENIRGIYQWINGQYLLLTRWNGLWVYHPQDNTINPLSFCQSKHILSAYVDSNSKLWVAPYDKGVQCYTPSGEQILDLSVTNTNLSNDVVLDIVEKDNNMWFATDGGGITIYNIDTNSSTTLQYIPGNTFSFPSNSIYCMYVDRMNNLWAGTIRAGLVNIKEVEMRTYKDSPEQSEYGLSEKTILNLTEDENGYVWIGTDGGGVNRFDPQNNTFKHFPTTNRMKIVSLIDYDTQHLLISNFSKGVSLFNKSTGALRPFTIVNNEISKKSNSLGTSNNLMAYNRDSIYIFTDSIYLFDKKRNQFNNLATINSKLSQSFLQQLSNDKKHTYLSHEHHISRINNTTLVVDTIYRTSYNVSINTSVEGKNNELWIATSDGLYHLAIGDTVANKIDIPHFQNVYSLVYDKQDRLWLGTHKMLYAYLIDKKRFIVFGDSDGASTNEYLSKPTLVAQDSSIYMGGVTGLLHISHSTTLPKATYSPALVLSNFYVDGKSMIDQDENKVIKIPWNHSVIAMQLLTRDKDIFREYVYRYTIIGEDSMTIETHRKELNLYSLPVGEYKVLVSCNTQNGDWNTPSQIISFSIYPPWWKTIWFYTLLVLLIIAILIAIVWYTIQRNNSKLELDKKEHERLIYEEKVQFLINISHELRTPLTLIYAPIKHLLDKTDKEDKIHLSLSQVMRQAKQMHNTINMVLDIRRMEVKNDILKIETINIEQWIKGIINNFSFEAEKNNIDIVYSANINRDTISLDREKCEIVLSNIIINSLKFSPMNSKINITVNIEDNQVKISISDEGIGLDHVDHDKLFSRYYQGEHSVSGSGIGLSYSKKLVELQGGKIGAENNSTGATFWFTLPLIQETQVTMDKKESMLNEVLSTQDTTYEIDPTNNTLDLSKYNIIIAEDDLNMQAFLAEALGELFKNVYLCNNGVEALEIMHTKQPDLIVSDVMMPYMNGYELCKQIKSDPNISHTPIVLLTARTDTDSTSLGYKLGADMYLPKPFDVENLVAIIKNILQVRDSLKQRYLNSANLVDPIKNTFSNSDENFILKLNTIITDNLNNPQLDVRFITLEIGMSRASLYKKFKAIAGLGINDYIINHRIEKASALLINSDYTIGEISDMVGVNNQRYFSTIFKQAKGVSPTEFRKQHNI